MYLSKESLVLDVFFPDVANTRLAKITREFHIVQDMDCGLLIGNDIIEPEGIVIDLAKKRMQISACDNMACRLTVRRKRRTNRVIIRCAKEIHLKGYSCGYVPIRFPKLKLNEYKFNGYPTPTGCLKYISDKPVIGKDMKQLYIFNFSWDEVTLPKDHKLGYIELPDPLQYTPVDVVQRHFRKVAEPESPRSSIVTNEAASVKATSPRQVTKKTSSALEKAPPVPPKSVRRPPPSLRTAVPSFLPVHSFLSPLLRSSFFFFYRPLFSGPRLWQSPLGIPCDCQNVPYFPPKPGLQLPPLVKLFTFATNC